MSRYDAAYARQSLLKKDSLSISGQLALCQKAAGEEKLTVYQDAGYSGKNTERPAFKRLLKDIKSDKIRRLYVYRLDRFSRSVADFGQLWEILRAHEVEFVSVSENFDTTAPMGRAMLHIIMVFAQLERETTAERVRDNYYRRAALGAWPGGPAPYGYENGRTAAPDGRQIPTLLPNENAAIVQRIFEEYVAKDMSLGRLARRLSEEGVPAPKRAVWDNVTLSRLLHSPVYVRANEQVRLHYLSLGAEVTSPAEDFDGEHGVLLVGKRKASDRKYTSLQEHTASVLNSVGIVSADLWLSAQAKLAHNRQVGNSGRGQNTWLTGLLKCAKCGYSLKVNREAAKRRMICSGRANLAHCDASIHLTLDELEAEVQRKIEEMLSELPVEEPSLQEDDTFVRRLAEIDRRADRLMDAFAESSDLPQSYLRRSLKKIEAERQEVLEERQRRQKRALPPTVLDFGKLAFEEKKIVAAQFIRRIEVASDSAEILWNV